MKSDQLFIVHGINYARHCSRLLYGSFTHLLINVICRFRVLCETLTFVHIDAVILKDDRHSKTFLCLSESKQAPLLGRDLLSNVQMTSLWTLVFP